jgi:hypothetical protein
MALLLWQFTISIILLRYLFSRTCVLRSPGAWSFMEHRYIVNLHLGENSEANGGLSGDERPSIPLVASDCNIVRVRIR